MGKIAVPIRAGGEWWVLLRRGYEGHDTEKGRALSSYAFGLKNANALLIKFVFFFSDNYLRSSSLFTSD